MATNLSPIALFRARNLAGLILKNDVFNSLKAPIRQSFSDWVISDFDPEGRKSIDSALALFQASGCPPLRLAEFDRILSPSAYASDDKDDENPYFLFRGVDTCLIAGILDGSIDPYAIAAAEMKNRGYDADGLWIGFKAAAEFDYYQKLK